ncbi:hypothetical protein MMC28_006083 [Mycoblastus sanguinarius]|nr:hypothetical protein [Mycoblastus sanguinarius]
MASSASAAALIQSMHHITVTKLATLSKQQDMFEEHKREVLKNVALEPKQDGRIRLLLDALRKEKIPTPKNISTTNIRLFLDQSTLDPSVSPSLLKEWQETLEHALDIPSHKYEHASLFGRMVMEWLKNPNDSSINSPGSRPEESFEHIGRKGMHDQRKEWESLVFATPTKSDPVAIEDYLARLFGSSSETKRLELTPLEILREQVESFRLGKFDAQSLTTTIKGLLGTDLLSDDKNKALRELQNSKMVLAEMADVLNKQIDALDSWSWGEEAVPLDMRRALNGKYRFFMEEEILQALLLHFVGTQWAVHIKMVFSQFFRSEKWKQPSHRSPDKTAKRRREAFLPTESSGINKITSNRREKYGSDYFLTQLPSAFEAPTSNYHDEESEDDIR